LLVGIDGDVPSDERNIRLGDVEANKPTTTFGGVVQFEIGKAAVGRIFERTWILKKLPVILMANIERLLAQQIRNCSQMPAYLAEMLNKFPNMRQIYYNLMLVESIMSAQPLELPLVLILSWGRRIWVRASTSRGAISEGMVEFRVAARFTDRFWRPRGYVRLHDFLHFHAPLRDRLYFRSKIEKEKSCFSAEDRHGKFNRKLWVFSKRYRILLRKWSRH
jgi:hypothetical protein